MKKTENECCGCAAPGYPCRGTACPNLKVTHYYCDNCGEEFDPEALYVNESDEELCVECFMENYDTVAQKER